MCKNDNLGPKAGKMAPFFSHVMIGVAYLDHIWTLSSSIKRIKVKI